MQITIKDRGQTLASRLGERLGHVEALRCSQHGHPVIAVTIDGRENGWFDTRWTTCCPVLAQQATTILKDRC